MKNLFYVSIFGAIMLIINIAGANPPKIEPRDIATVQAKTVEVVAQKEEVKAPVKSLDIRSGLHEVTEDERSIIKENFLTRWDESEWDAFDKLIGNESGWIAGRLNLSSGACGLGQALPCSKYTQGAELGDAINEANWSMDYILNRYKTPGKALSFWHSRSETKKSNWY